MANVGPTVWYVDSAQWTSAVSAWTALTSYVAGSRIRQLATPTVGNERVFVQLLTSAPTSGAAEPTWTVTKGAKTTDATCTWQECTGQPGVNGDTTNSPTWLQNKNTAISLGLVIYDSVSGALQIVSTAGTTGNGAAPSFSATAGTTTADNTVTWTSLGAASNFTKWMAPHARLANAFASSWGTAGNSFYFGDDHAETQSTAITLASPGTAALPCSVYGVDHTTAVPPTASNLKTGGSATTTGATNLGVQGHFYIYGLTLNCGSGNVTSVLGLSNNSVDTALTLDTCALVLPTTGSGAIMILGASSGNAQITTLINTTVKFGNTGQNMRLSNGVWNWKNTASAIDVAGSIPTTLIGGANNQSPARVMLDGVDLSGTTGTIIGASVTPYYAQLVNCRLNASVTVSGTPTSNIGSAVDLIISDSGANAYRQESYRYTGTLTTSTTSYNGATDGVTSISWHVVTTANSSRAFPFECFQIVQWVAAGTYTASVVQITSATASLLNSDVWVDAEYLGNASYPISSLASSAPATLLTAGSSLAAGTWATSGLGNNYKLALPSFTTNLAGYVRFTVKVAKASLTLNIDPAVTVA